MCFAPDSYLAFLHDLQQRALHLSRRAVDLIRQQQVGENRAERSGEFAGFLVEDPRADQVGRHKIGRELDAFELASDGLRQCLDCQGFGKPRHSFYQDVAARQQRHQHPLQQVILPDNNLLDFVQQTL